MSVLDMFSLEGKVALVTGGAGLYGRQVVRAVAEAGAETAVASRNVEVLEEMAASMRDEGLKVRAFQFDQGDEASVLALRDALLETYGRIDILVNNAVARPLKKGMQSPLDEFAESMRINATGLLAITRAMGDAMAARGSGAIVNVGSIYGMVGPDPTNYRGTDMSGWSPDYGFHKGGMVTFTKFLASYYGASNVRVNCVSPGGLQAETHPAAFVKNYSDHTCLGRLAGETDLMGAIVFLASDASAYVTGANLPVDGGYTVK